MTTNATPKAPRHDERAAARLAALSRQRAERKDPLDLPGNMTLRQRTDYGLETMFLDRKIDSLRRSVQRVAELDGADHDADRRWRDFLTLSRQRLSDELGTIKSPMRNPEVKARADALMFSLKIIDRGLAANGSLGIVTLAPTPLGQLMREAGYDVDGPGLRGPNGFRGFLSEIDARVKKHEVELESAIATLEQQLLPDDEIAKRDAEAKQLRDAFNNLRVVGRAGGGLRVLDEDGDERDLSTLSPLERRAFEQADSAERAREQERRAAAGI
jgi:hypothetical protein